MSELTAGQKAPDFELPDQDGKSVRLSRLLADGPVVMFFYPKDDTTGCTKEACGFRDRIDDFNVKGAQVVGISSDSRESHGRFAAKFKLPYTLLSDHGGKVRKLYGVKSTFGIIPGRATFVIDRAGVVRHSFNSQTQPEKHIAEALRALSGQ